MWVTIQLCDVQSILWKVSIRIHEGVPVFEGYLKTDEDHRGVRKHRLLSPLGLLQRQRELE